MKRSLIIIVIALAVLLIGSFAFIPLNGVIWNLMGLEGGYDDEMRMFNVLVFVEWPIFIIIGSVIGNKVFKRYLAHKSRRR